MRRKCPKCGGNGMFKSAINHAVNCYVCNKKGEVYMLKESVARRMVHGNYADLATQGWHATAGTDATTKLMIVIYPDKEFECPQVESKTDIKEGLTPSSNEATSGTEKREPGTSNPTLTTGTAESSEPSSKTKASSTA